MTERMRQGARALGLELSDRQLAQFERYYELLTEWNERINLTAITQKDEVAEKHFLDSLGGAAAVREVLDRGGRRLIDVGTGAGFPGIPLKILFPELELTLLDFLQKRIRFLEEVCRELGLENVTCVHGRAEEAAHLPQYRESFDIAVSRAVAPMSILLEYCAGYLKPGACLLAYKGPSLPGELADARRELTMLGMSCRSTLEVTVPGADWTHYVAIVDKRGKLALQYPRKQSKIKKSTEISRGQ